MWTGAQPVRHVLIIATNLVLNPRSQCYSIRMGAENELPWDATTYAVARMQNSLVTLIAGIVGATDADLTPFYATAPGEKKTDADGVEEIHFATIAEFSIAGANKFFTD